MAMRDPPPAILIQVRTPWSSQTPNFTCFRMAMQVSPWVCLWRFEDPDARNSALYPPISRSRTPYSLTMQSLSPSKLLVNAEQRSKSSNALPRLFVVCVRNLTGKRTAFALLQAEHHHRPHHRNLQRPVLWHDLVHRHLLGRSLRSCCREVVDVAALWEVGLAQGARDCAYRSCGGI